ncbi:hypothetical protein OAT67_05495 [Bacteriovoracaceae bacterium]|nr:hypothetical protein [Bacteriovoracaceae bacterium]
MKILFVMFSLILSLQSMAQSNADMSTIGSIGAISKKDIQGMLDQMVKNGRITKAQAAKAKEKLGSMDEKEVKGISDEAMKRIQSGNIPK